MGPHLIHQRFHRSCPFHACTKIKMAESDDEVGLVDVKVKQLIFQPFIN